MIQDEKLIGDRDFGTREFGDHADDITVGHVARGIIVGSDHEESVTFQQRSRVVTKLG